MIILSVLFLSTLTAATAGYRWWKGRDNTPVAQQDLPSATEEYKKLMRSYGHANDSLPSIAGTIRIYDEENKGQLKETRSFRYLRCGAGFYMRLSYLQTFCDGKWLLQLDTIHRQIVVEKANGQIPGGMMGPAMTPETLFSDTARFRTTGIVKVEGNWRSLRLQSELNPEIRSSTLFYDTLRYRLRKAELERWKPGSLPDEKGDKIWLVKIDYQYPAAETMDLRRRIRSMVSVDDRKPALATAYQDYELTLNNN
jgi:hypothetical protein